MMDWLRELWLWIALGVVALVLLGVRVFVIGDYITAERKNLKALASLVEKVDKSVSNLEKLPTRGDIEQANAQSEDIREEGLETAALWRKAGRALDEEHGVDPGRFTVFLHGRCNEMVEELAGRLPRLRAETLRDALATGAERWKGPLTGGGALDRKRILDRHGLDEDDYDALLAGEATPLRIWVSEPAAQQLVSLEKDFVERQETELPWRRYLISRRIHRIVGETAVVLEASYVVPVENEIPDQVATPQVRMIERLGKIAFSAPERVRRDERPRGGEASIADYDVHPVRFEVVAHPRVLEALMRRFLEDDGMLFVPESVETERYDEKATRPDGATVEKVMAIDSDALPAPVRSVLLPGYEPPIRATLRYRVHHFQGFGMEEASD